MRASIVLSVVGLACASRSLPAGSSVSRSQYAGAAPVAAVEGVQTVAWADVRLHLEALVCIVKEQLEGQPPFEGVNVGNRVYCRLPPPATPLERAVDRAWSAALPVVTATGQDESESVRAALRIGAIDARLAAVRRAYLSDRILGLLVAHLAPALAAEGLRCAGLPPPFVPEQRMVAWDTFAPYLSAYAWPDPVITPRDARGQPSGEPKYTMHICLGINGISELPHPDPALVELGFLASFFNPSFIDRAPALFKDLRDEDEFRRITDDAARTRWLRHQLGPRLTHERAMRVAVCRTVATFRSDTGIEIRECGHW